MKRIHVVITLMTYVLTGCAVNNSARENVDTASAIEVVSVLFDETERNFTERDGRTLLGRGTGYDLIWGYRCLPYKEFQSVQDVTQKFSAICSKYGGSVGAKGLCRNISRPDDVLFAARFDASGSCDDGPSVGFEVVSPTAGVDDDNYIRRLGEFGYRLSSETPPNTRLDTLFLQLEEDSTRGNEVLASKIGTLICKSGVVQYFLSGGVNVVREEEGTLVAELMDVVSSELKIQFRALELRIPNQTVEEKPYSSHYLMDGLEIVPNRAYWDRAWSGWKICER